MRVAVVRHLGRNRRLRAFEVWKTCWCCSTQAIRPHDPVSIEQIMAESLVEMDDDETDDR